MKWIYIYIDKRGSLTSQSLRLHLTCPRISSITLGGFSRQGTYVFLLILLRKSVIKVIFVGVFFLTWFLHQDSLFWWWINGSLRIFDFFNRHHFFFHISFLPPSFGFDDADFFAFTGLLRSLPFNLHLFPVCLFHEVQFGIEYLLF